MTLRTPRRRISPRTKRRYRAIKGFFRRALGTTSQPDLQITSSIAVNVTDIKHKLGTELQHTESRDFDHNDDADSEKGSPAHTQQSGDEINRTSMQSETPLAGVETKILYKTSGSHYKKSEDSELEKPKNESYVIVNDDMSGYYDAQSAKKQNKRSKVDSEHLINVNKKLRKQKTKSVYESFTSDLSASTFHSLNQFKGMVCIDPGDIGFEEEKIFRTGVHNDHNQNRVYKEINKPLRQDMHDNHASKEHQSKSKQKNFSKELDYDFIADIIKRQYKPVQIGRKVSDLSQFSAPECRDTEFYFNNNDENNVRLSRYDNIVACDNHNYHTKHLNCSDHCGFSGNIDSRPHGYKRKSRINRRKLACYYNDSDVYDLVPVRERTSPKSRRTYFEDNMASPAINREVLPSPRSHRPKLNLKAQYHTDFEDVLDDMVTVKNSVPKRLLHRQLIENENYTQLRRALSKRQLDHDNERDYVIKPYKIIPPNMVTQQLYNEGMNINVESMCLPIRKLQQYENNNHEDSYVIGPSKNNARRQLHQYEMEDQMDYNTPPNRVSPRKRMQYYGYDYEYMPRPSRRFSPKRTMQHFENEDHIQLRRCSSRRISPKRIIQQAEMNDVIANDNRPKRNQNRNNTMRADVANEMGTESFQCSSSVPQNNTLTPETPSNKTQDALISEDKTDKALHEIKDILQSFLREIKRESQSEKSDISNKTTMNCNVPADASGPHNSFNDYAAMQCPMASSPLMAEHANNTCCYPIIPLCPMSYMQNGFPAPNPSFTCTHCATKLNETAANKCNESTCNENLSKHAAAEETFKTDTNELIKEIYKFVSQSPTFGRKKAVSTERLNNSRNCLKPALKSRGAGGSGEVYIQNAKVGTPRTNCVSKSCEAITQKSSEAYTSETNASYSETVLEKASLEATITATESITETDTTDAEIEKAKLTKFSKAMKSWNIFKKNKKKDVIEELSESEQDKEQKKSPFHQNITNYMMHGQEYFVPPPVGPNFNYCPQNYRPSDYVNCGLPYNPGVPDYSMSLPTQEKCRAAKMATAPPQDACPYSYYHGQCPTAPQLCSPYDTYGQMPQGPLCLQEVEVKSIGCQSEKKLSFFRKIGIKNQNQKAMPQFEFANKTCSTQTAQYANNKPGGLFKWPKPMDHRDTLNFNYKTEKKLAAGDIKMRKAMIKKMFYKKNPFSTNNLIIKTLLGRDRSSYGEAPTMYRPRLFM